MKGGDHDDDYVESESHSNKLTKEEMEKLYLLFEKYVTGQGTVYGTGYTSPDPFKEWIDGGDGWTDLDSYHFHEAYLEQLETDPED